MADVFISYSQGAPEPTQSLAAELTALRYAVWFDSRLLPGDAFWQVIEDKIIAAKAVIVIWTRPALISRGVRAEAQLAYDKNKLICVRTPDVAASEVRLPFNALEQSLVTDRAKIYAALAQLGAHPITGARPVLPKGERDAGEAALAWDHIKSSGDVGDFDAFLAHYGEGHAFYARLARKRIAELRGERQVPVPAAARPSATAAAVPMPKAEDVFLRIEAGMHTAAIRHISLSADGRLMATGSDDKTVRLWSLPDGKLVRTLRPPIGPGNEGKVYAVALAPDGSWVAAGG